MIDVTKLENHPSFGMFYASFNLFLTGIQNFTSTTHHPNRESLWQFIFVPFYIQIDPNKNATFDAPLVSQLSVNSKMSSAVTYTSPVVVDPDQNSLTLSIKIEDSIPSFMTFTENSNKSFTITLDPSKITPNNRGIHNMSISVIEANMKNESFVSQRVNILIKAEYFASLTDEDKQKIT
jgi:hypothetical protein